MVPFVEETGHYFLKTVIPNRKATLNETATTVVLS